MTSGVVFADNDALTAIGATSLVTMGGRLTIRENQGLTLLDFPSLTTLTGLLIERNHKLPTCEATSLRDQLILAGWTGTATIRNNLPGGTCP